MLRILDYWTKFQIDKSIKLPSVMVNPTFDKIIALFEPAAEA